MAAIVAIAIALSARAPAPRPRGGAGLTGRFKQPDRDGNGDVAAGELPDPQFKQKDKDGDGFVTLENPRDRQPPAEVPAIETKHFVGGGGTIRAFTKSSSLPTASTR